MIVEHCYSLLLLHLTFCIELLLMYSCTKFFVNLNGNMVVVGNKFFPLWRHFQKFHTNRCQAHLTITGVLKRKNMYYILIIGNQKKKIIVWIGSMIGNDFVILWLYRMI